MNLYLPELSTLFQGFDNLSLDKLGSLYNSVQRQTSSTEATTPSARQSVVKRLFTKEGMKQNSNAVSNPFDALSTMFENVPLIKVNTRNINIQIPFISQEDLVKYKAYLDDRLKRNEKILQEWTMVAQDAAGKCDTYTSASDRSACKEKLAAYANVSLKAGQVIKALKGNINTLEEYRKFPLELNKRLSVSQRYLTEVSDTVATFFGSLNHWLQLNSRRFEQYVDAIILVISAVKTWQVLIDFSVNRKTKCGKCRVDNYDFYSCTLSLLCINLPVLPIPPFRIPNIDIDLSNINVGLDILLPKFNFVPKNIPLPRLPDLPSPPSLDLKVDLNVMIPQIPVLPTPPKLPELPSFIPNIELNLPNLPPAPRIPKIAPQIQATLKVAEFIAKIFCIVKGGIGLVSEK
ncbi:hypothetical protein KBC03_03480 [Patescibacteria group bacterium]|nr:hypothetical protein [Patescibacteria group bacterium]